MAEEFRSLALIGAGRQVAPDFLNVFVALDAAKSAGQIVDLETVYSNAPLRVTFEDTSEVVEAQLIDEESALTLADIDLARFRLPEQFLSRRELKLRSVATSTMAPELIVVRQSFADIFRRMGGVAVYRGTLNGVSAAAQMFNEMKLAPDMN